MHAKQNQDLGIASNEGRESYTTAKDSLVRVCIEKKNNYFVHDWTFSYFSNFLNNWPLNDKFFNL